MKARFKNECFICYRVIRPGMSIMKTVSNRYVHEPCGQAAVEKARNAALINGGYTYAGRKPSEWRIGASPSDGARPLPMRASSSSRPRKRR